MRALSIRQPWAELILRGVKTVEARPKRTHKKGERVQIYAGLQRIERRRGDPNRNGVRDRHGCVTPRCYRRYDRDRGVRNAGTAAQPVRLLRDNRNDGRVRLAIAESSAGRRLEETGSATATIVL